VFAAWDIAKLAMTVLSTEHLLVPELCYIDWFSRLSPKEHSQAMQTSVGLVGDGHCMRVATLCAGSEVPMIWLRSCLRVLRSRHLGVDWQHPSASPSTVLRHVFACEIEPAKQNWIRKNILPALLFPDVACLGRDKCYDIISGQYVLVPGSDCAIAGTSCKDLSPQKATGKQNVMSSASGTSSVTMLGLLAYVSRHQPACIMGENVLNLLSGENFNWVREQFRLCGYVLFFVEQDPTFHRVSHSRPRVYFWGFLTTGTLWFVTREASVVQGAINAMLERLKHKPCETVDVLEFAPDDTSDTCSNRFISTSVPEFDEEAKWLQIHVNYCNERSIVYPVQHSAYDLPAATQEACFPVLTCLPLRELDYVKVMDKLLCQESGTGRLQNGKVIFADLSQCVSRECWNFNMLPCILPGSKFLDASEASIISAVHLARMQGILKTIDTNLNYAVTPERTLADMSGNAMNGWCFGSTFFVMLATSASNVNMRVPRKLSSVFAARLERDDHAEAVAKKHKPDSGLGILLSLFDK
jgi:site-specific DNA-cytosine methylase